MSSRRLSSVLFKNVVPGIFPGRAAFLFLRNVGLTHSNRRYVRITLKCWNSEYKAGAVSTRIPLYNILGLNFKYNSVYIYYFSSCHYVTTVDAMYTLT